MQFSFFLFCGYVGVTLLSPVMHNLWIWRGTGNANFYFATAMAYACLQVWLNLHLLRWIRSESDNGRSVAVIKSNKDTRYGLDSIVTHDGAKLTCWALPDLLSFKDRLGADYDKELFFAGADTRTSTVEWALAELMKDPEAMGKARFEHATVTSGKVVKESDLPHLTYNIVLEK